jgi:hypothetical protein
MPPLTVSAVLSDAGDVILSFAGPLLVQGALVKMVRNVHEGTRPEGALALLNFANNRLVDPHRPAIDPQVRTWPSVWAGPAEVG